MDMQDPSLAPNGGEVKEQTLNEAPASAEAVEPQAAPAETAAESLESIHHEDPEEVAEALMSEAENEADEKNGRRLDSYEAILEEALILFEKDPADIGADELRRLRQHFNILQKNTETAEAEAKAAAESDEEKTIDPKIEADKQKAAELSTVLENLRAKKAAWTAAQEAQRAANLERKNAIIAEILALADDTDNVNRTFPRYRELQDEFNSAGDVEPTEETALWKRYQDAREKYSDNLKINKELRDYDFKKNLAEKEQLLDEARALVNADDVISAYRRLQELHNRWRLIGPVAKELREEIWANFREASAEVNKRYQAFFEERKAREAENEQAKTALCEQIEAIDFTNLKTFAAWDETTKAIMALQEEWRKLGFASKRMNRTLFARFRGVCDAFFAAKAEFFRNTREELAANLAHKQQLVEQAEALKDSTDWREATDRFVAMQKEWKTIGAIPKKYSDALWNRFTTACDYFFDQKKKAGSGTRQTEMANLQAKRQIIGELSALTAEGVEKNDAVAALRELQQRWQQTGHVPFREKDKLYEAYRAAVDAVRKQFAIAESRARRERFEANMNQMEGDSDKLFSERNRLTRALENRRNDLRTYENNLGFLSSKSKSGDSLVRDMERRIERLKADIAEIQEKINLIDGKL